MSSTRVFETISHRCRSVGHFCVFVHLFQKVAEGMFSGGNAQLADHLPLMNAAGSRKFVPVHATRPHIGRQRATSGPDSRAWRAAHPLSSKGDAVGGWRGTGVVAGRDRAGGCEAELDCGMTRARAHCGARGLEVRQGGVHPSPQNSAAEGGGLGPHLRRAQQGSLRWAASASDTGSVRDRPCEHDCAGVVVAPPVRHCLSPLL